MTSIVLIRVNFYEKVCGVRLYVANFRVIIRSKQKFEVYFKAKIREVSRKVRCDMNNNHPSQCCVMAARNIGSITSCCSRKELETEAKNRPNQKHGQDVFIDVNSTALLNSPC